MELLVSDDDEFVRAECERIVEGAETQCDWNPEMIVFVGKRGKVEDLDEELQAAGMRFSDTDGEWWFPFTVLSVQ